MLNSGKFSQSKLILPLSRNDGDSGGGCDDDDDNSSAVEDGTSYSSGLGTVPTATTAQCSGSDCIICQNYELVY